MQISQLILELTRKCNLFCSHCLRGNAQKIDINTKTIIDFLKKNEIRSISELVFTGGEPCLNVSAMKIIIDYLCDNNIQVYRFYMATNGTIFNNDMLDPLSKLYSLIDDEESFLIEISNDKYHTGKIDSKWKLMNFKYRDNKEINIIPEGRGLDFGGNRIIKDDEWEWSECNGEKILEGLVYINVIGHILKNCDYSYKSQKIKHYGHCLSQFLEDF